MMPLTLSARLAFAARPAIAARSFIAVSLAVAALPLISPTALAQTVNTTTPSVQGATAGDGTPKTFPPVSDCAALDQAARVACENRRKRASREAETFDPSKGTPGVATEGVGTVPGMNSSGGSMGGLPSESGSGSSMGTRNTLNNTVVPNTGRASDPNTVGNPRAGTPNESGTGVFTTPGASAPGSGTGGSGIGGLGGGSSGSGSSSGSSSGGGSSGGGSSGGSSGGSGGGGS